MAQAIYLEQYQQRQEAAMGFEDDLDFCPSLTSKEVRDILQSSTTLSQKENRSRPSRPFHLPLALSSFSPSTSPSSLHSPPLLSPPLVHGSSPIQSPPTSAPVAQASRAIPIVDPSSGEAVQLPLNAVALRSPLATPTTSVYTASSLAPSRIATMSSMVTAETAPTMQEGYIEMGTPFEHDPTTTMSLTSSGSEEDSEMGSPVYHSAPGTEPESSFAPYLCFVPEFETAYFHPQEHPQEEGLFRGLVYEGVTGAPGPFYLPSPLFIPTGGSPAMGMSPPSLTLGAPFYSSPMAMHPLVPQHHPHHQQPPSRMASRVSIVNPEDGTVVSVPPTGPSLGVPEWHQHTYISVR